MADLNARERLIRDKAVLDTLEYCREKTGIETLGADIERVLLTTTCNDVKLQTRLNEVDEELARRTQ